MPRASLKNLIKSRKSYALVGLIILIVLIGGGLFYFIRHKNQSSFSTNKNIVFSIDGQNYSKQDVQKLIAYPLSQHVSENMAAKEAFTNLKEIKAAQKIRYVPSTSAINAQKNLVYTAVKATSAQQSQYSNWFTLVATRNAIDASINSLNTIGYAGYSYVFFFGQHIQSSPDYTPTGLNNPKLIAQDKAYAQQQANYYHQQLQDNKMSLADALTKSGASMQLRGHSVGNPNYNANFTTDENLKVAVYLPSIVQYITSTNKTGLSDVKIGQAPNAPLKSHGKNVNMYYYFVDLTTAPQNTPVSTAQFNQTLNKLPAEFRGFSS